MTAHPDVRKISFTGSTSGAKVMAGAAGLLKRITLELGENDAGIVLDDVNPKEASAQKLFDSAFQNSGQMYRYEASLCAREHLRRGVRGTGEHCQRHHHRRRRAGYRLGALNNKMQYDKVKALIEDAKKEGNVIAGGEFPDKPKLLHSSNHRARH